jgi:hypothetical protein
MISIKGKKLKIKEAEILIIKYKIVMSKCCILIDPFMRIPKIKKGQISLARCKGLKKIKQYEIANMYG